MKHTLNAAALTLFACSAGADPVVQKAADIHVAFENWAIAQNVENAGLVVMHKGVVAGPTHNAEIPVEMASLSKAITAVCATRLIEEGHWTAQTTSADVLGFGHEDITVAQLVSHTAGLMPDSTQLLTPMWMTSTFSRKRIVSETALNRERIKIGSYQYNNENYGILGEMIEVSLGVSYEQACAERALAPAGVTGARSSPVMGGMLPWGGWYMTATEYARFHFHWFGPEGAYAKGSPSELRVALGGGAEYGLGMFERAVADHRNFWHFGLWCVGNRLNAGAYAVIWQGEWSAVATYDACVDWDAMGALDAAMVDVVYDR